MVSTRSASNSQESPSKTNGKRAAESNSSPPAKRGKTANAPKVEENEKEKSQKTIEETMEGIEKVEDDDEVKKQIEEKDDEKPENESAKQDDTATEIKGANSESSENQTEKQDEAAGSDKKPEQNGGVKEGEKNAFDEVKADAGEVKQAAKTEEKEMDNAIADNKDSVVKDKEREASMPSSILEKGVIYFFFRGRVGIEDPQSVDDIARSYIVLRPLPIGAKLGDGPLEDSGNARLLALPKKVLPKSHSDRFLMFVEKAKSTVKELKEQFISGSDYSTKTSGTSHSPAATPIAEGIYAITTTGRESHLAYHITVPELGEVQKDLGLNEKGSYVLSVKNPTASGPANATLDNAASYPEELMKEFRGLRWTPLKPEFLEYQHTQFLIIGEGLGELSKAVVESEKDKKDDDKDAPIDELEKLEDEDTRRVEHLKGDDAVFADLGLSSKEYPRMQTTW